MRALAALAATAAGFWALRRTQLEDDPGWIVIDEVAGQWVALIPATDPISALAGFALVVPFIVLMFNMANGGMGGSVAAALARAMGAGRLDDARALVWHALALGLVLAIAFIALAWTVVPPMFSASCGVPVTVTASLIVTVTLTTSPAFSVLFWMPVAPVIATELTVGEVVSTR